MLLIDTQIHTSCDNNHTCKMHVGNFDWVCYHGCMVSLIVHNSSVEKRKDFIVYFQNEHLAHHEAEPWQFTIPWLPSSKVIVQIAIEVCPAPSSFVFTACKVLSLRSNFRIFVSIVTIDDTEPRVSSPTAGLFVWLVCRRRAEMTTLPDEHVIANLCQQIRPDPAASWAKSPSEPRRRKTQTSIAHWLGEASWLRLVGCNLHCIVRRFFCS